MSAARSSTATATTGIARPTASESCGRFAPTPSGPLHLGSLLAAAGSYLNVRSQGGRWLLRIDDLDRERCLPGLAAQCQATLESFGFEWDGNVYFQSDRIDIYTEAVRCLQAAGRTYACRCSRAAVAAALIADPASEPVYPGTCRREPASEGQPHARPFPHRGGRFAIVEFQDIFQGPVRQDCQREAGDFVIQRRDGPVAYHLAVVVDDELQGVTEVVRGSDLLSSTPRQILLQRTLGYRTPRYGHLPLLTEPDGRKLAKSRRAVPLEASLAPQQLWQVLHWLEQEPPAEISRATVREIWSWAIANWRPERLVSRRERRLEGQVTP